MQVILLETAKKMITSFSADFLEKTFPNGIPVTGESYTKLDLGNDGTGANAVWLHCLLDIKAYEDFILYTLQIRKPLLMLFFEKNNMRWAFQGMLDIKFNSVDDAFIAGPLMKAICHHISYEAPAPYDVTKALNRFAEDCSGLSVPWKKTSYSSARLAELNTYSADEYMGRNDRTAMGYKFSNWLIARINQDGSATTADFTK